MRLAILYNFVLFAAIQANAQTPQVPSRMEFAGIKLKISDGARAEIQETVNSLTASPKYYNVLAERARTFFPIIERVFREQDLPDDFKYLSLQESALISDAVSSSNAVGYWQFKDFTAVEVGMRVDKTIDERKNIVSSSKGAARYMHNNNQFFDNWLHTLQAYQMGAGGAMKVLKKGMEGAKSMNVTKSTYWYVKKFLAHKVAFENVMEKSADLAVSEYYDGAGKSLKQISKEVDIDEAELAMYNKWLKKGAIPSDKKYAVIIPGKHETIAQEPIVKVEDKPRKKIEYTFDKAGEFPKIENEAEARAGEIVDINGVPGIIAGKGDRIPDLAKKAEISLSKFLKYNDLGIDGMLVPGQVYYIKRKRNKAKAYYHVAQYNETLWSISQKFGIKLKKLKLKNRIEGDEDLKPGRVLWLRYIRPANVDIEYKSVPVPYIGQPVKKEVQKKPMAIIQDSAKIEQIVTPVVTDGTVIHKELDTLQVEQAQPTYKVAKEEVELDSVYAEELVADERVVADSALAEQDEVFEELVQKTHDVKMGETFYAISKKYNVSVLDLIEWNNLTINDKLSIGQKLIVKVKKEKKEILSKESSEESEFIYHEVKEGETLYGISRNYNVSVQDIIKWNALEGEAVKYGEKLKIKLSDD